MTNVVIRTADNPEATVKLMVKTLLPAWKAQGAKFVVKTKAKKPAPTLGSWLNCCMTFAGPTSNTALIQPIRNTFVALTKRGATGPKVSIVKITSFLSVQYS